MKKIFVIWLLWGVSSCSGYFNPVSPSGDQAVTLAMQGGGYLSEAGPNEVSPFVFRLSNNDPQPILFYASDRDGDFDIYMARMDANGLFLSRSRISNTSSQDKWPIVVMNGTNVVLSYLANAGGAVIIKSFLLNPLDFSIISNTQDEELPSDVIALGINVSDTLSSPGNILVFNGSKTVSGYMFNTFSSKWDTSITPLFSQSFSNNIYSGSMQNNQYIQDDATYSVLECRQNGQSSWMLDIDAYFMSMSLSTNFNSFPLEWSSAYTDQCVFVDFFGSEKKVYFSSKRIGNDFDLYRYNTHTLNNATQLYPVTNLINHILGL